MRVACLVVSLALLAPGLARATDDAPAPPGAFALRLVSSELRWEAKPPSDLGGLALDPEVLVHPEDVLAWDGAALTITPESASRLRAWRERASTKPFEAFRPFVLVADGARVLLGWVVPPMRSAPLDQPTVLLDDLGATRLEVLRSYHGDEKGPDPRQDPRLVLAGLRLEVRRWLDEKLRRDVDACWKGDRTGSTYPGPLGAVAREHASLLDVPAATLVACLDDQALAEHPVRRELTLALGLAHPAEGRARVRAIAAAEGRDEYERLDAALALALQGDAAATPILRRALDEGFAMSQSGFEVGEAALGLALLGDREHLEAVRAKAGAANVKDDVALAVRVLEATPRR